MTRCTLRGRDGGLLSGGFAALGSVDPNGAMGGGNVVSVTAVPHRSGKGGDRLFWKMKPRNVAFDFAAVRVGRQPEAPSGGKCQINSLMGGLDLHVAAPPLRASPGFCL